MKKVLFVYVENARRSQMAEAFLNKLAKGQAVVASAGDRPARAKFREVRNEIRKRVGKLVETSKNADK